MKIEDARTRDQLVEAIARSADEKGGPKFLFFWGHTPKFAGSVDRSCFSQWFPAEFTIDDITYRTAEHYMMAEKARLFSDNGILAQILECIEPGAAKKLGRRVADYDNEKWQAFRFEAVVRGNVAKFSQNEELLEFLLTTGTQVLVEASPRDRIWGIGMGGNNPDASNPARWRGQNLLGFALMQARQEILNSTAD